MPQFISTPLYGGAIDCELPDHFADVRYVAQAFRASFRTSTDLRVNSKLRQVPDNQEVWIDKDGFTSIIFDITERVGEPGTGPEIDGKAITTHLEELVGNDVEGLKIWNTAETEFSRLEYTRTLLSLRQTWLI